MGNPRLKGGEVDANKDQLRVDAYRLGGRIIYRADVSARYPGKLERLSDLVRAQRNGAHP